MLPQLTREEKILFALLTTGHKKRELMEIIPIKFTEYLSIKHSLFKKLGCEFSNNINWKIKKN